MGKKVFQSFNNRTDTWVKFSVSKKDGSKIISSKKKDKTTPFKGVPVRK